MKDETVSSLFLLLVISMIRQQEIMRSNYLLDSEDCSQVYQRVYHGSQGHTVSLKLTSLWILESFISPSLLPLQTFLSGSLSPLDIFRSFSLIKENFLPAYLHVSAFLSWSFLFQLNFLKESTLTNGASLHIICT